MPHDFAARLWVLTKLGARVIIARSEVKPVSFSDPRLFARKEPSLSPVATLRPAVEAVRTAQAIDTSNATDAPAALSATRSAVSAAPVPETAEADGTAVKAVEIDPSLTAAGRQIAAGIAAGLEADESPAGSTEAEPATASDPPAEAANVEPAASDAPTTAAIAPPAAAAEPTAVSAVRQGEPEKPASVQAALPPLPPDIVPISATEEVPLPQPRPADIAKILAERAGPIAVFISRKEGKIFVRQRTMPVLEAPVTIRDPQQPLGTHVFTAMAYLDDGESFRWTAVTLPGEPPKPERHAKGDKSDKDGKKGKHRAHEEPAPKHLDLKPPQTAREALGRIEIAQDVRDRISELMIPGSSVVISDSGLGPETGKYTDFIVLTR
jgi:hypothetical protein